MVVYLLFNFISNSLIDYKNSIMYIEGSFYGNIHFNEYRNRKNPLTKNVKYKLLRFILMISY